MVLAWLLDNKKVRGGKKETARELVLWINLVYYAVQCQGSCDHGNETSGFVKKTDFLYLLKYSFSLEKNQHRSQSNARFQPADKFVIYIYVCIYI